jgi:acetyl esterase/lipase
MPADGSRRVVLYIHGGGFLTCGANTHDRLVTKLSEYADTPVLVMNYRMMPKHSIGESIDDCYDGYRWLRGGGYGPEQIVLAGDSAGGYLSIALAQRLLNEGEELAAIVCMSPLMQISKAPKQAHPNIRSDAMFCAKAFDAFVELIAKAAARRRTMDGRPEEIYEPLDHIEAGLPPTLIPEPLPAEPATPSTAALRSVGVHQRREIAPGGADTDHAHWTVHGDVAARSLRRPATARPRGAG